MIGDRVTIIGVPSTRGDAWSPEAVKARGAINVRSGTAGRGDH